MTEPNEKDPESKTKERRNILTGKKKIDRNIYNGGHEKEIIEEKIR